MDFFVPGIVEGAGSYARQHRLKLDARWSVRADWMPDQPAWDGVLVNLWDMEGALQKAESLGLPMVHLSGALRPQSRPRVEPDFGACGRMAAAEFRSMGVRKVAALPGGVHPAAWRSYRGLRAAMRELGMEWIPTSKWNSESGWNASISRLCREVIAGGLPCGLFAPHAGIIFSLLEEFERHGVSVPADVPVIVIDKDPQRTAELSPVPLTAVNLDNWQQGYEAAALLHRMMAGREAGRGILRIRPLGISRRSSTGVDQSSDPTVEKALHTLRSRPAAELDVPMLVATAGVSRRLLEQKFRAGMGHTLHEAITKRKIDESKRLLRSSEIPLADIAELCGYSSVHYFSTAFRRETGMTPGRYRRAGQ